MISKTTKFCRLFRWERHFFWKALPTIVVLTVSLALVGWLFRENTPLLSTDDQPLFPVPRNLHAFYHVYAQGDQQRVLDVVNEQLAYLKNEPSFRDRLASVHYTVVGEHWQQVSLSNFSISLEPLRKPQKVEETAFIKNPQSAEEGWETLTLDNLYSHCFDNDDEIVAYMHTKGLFHSTPENEVLRLDHMMSLTSPCCLDALTHNSADVCGMRFSPVPHFHYGGNMWIARCDYINKLMQPSKFETIATASIKPIYNLCDSCTGWGRFSAEHWIGIHPTLRAMDVMPENATLVPGEMFHAGYNLLPKTPNSWTPECQAAPRNVLSAIRNEYGGWGGKPKGRMREYQVLFGHEALNLSKRSLEMDVNATCSLSACVFFDEARRIPVQNTVDRVFKSEATTVFNAGSIICPAHCLS